MFRGTMLVMLLWLMGGVTAVSGGEVVGGVVDADRGVTTSTVSGDEIDVEAATIVDKTIGQTVHGFTHLCTPCRDYSMVSKALSMV